MPDARHQAGVTPLQAVLRLHREHRPQRDLFAFRHAGPDHRAFIDPGLIRHQFEYAVRVDREPLLAAGMRHRQHYRRWIDTLVGRRQLQQQLEAVALAHWNVIKLVEVQLFDQFFVGLPFAVCGPRRPSNDERDNEGQQRFLHRVWACVCVRSLNAQCS